MVRAGIKYARAFQHRPGLRVLGHLFDKLRVLFFVHEESGSDDDHSLTAADPYFCAVAKLCHFAQCPAVLIEDRAGLSDRFVRNLFSGPLLELFFEQIDHKFIAHLVQAVTREEPVDKCDRRYRLLGLYSLKFAKIEENSDDNICGVGDGEKVDLTSVSSINYLFKLCANYRLKGIFQILVCLFQGFLGIRIDPYREHTCCQDKFLRHVESQFAQYLDAFGAGLGRSLLPVIVGILECQESFAFQSAGTNTHKSASSFLEYCANCFESAILMRNWLSCS